MTRKIKRHDSRKNDEVVSHYMLCREVALDMGYGINDVKEVIEKYHDVIAQHTLTTKQVKLGGLGTFYLTILKGKKTHDVNDLSRIVYSDDKFKIKFNPSLGFREMISDKEITEEDREKIYYYQPKNTNYSNKGKREHKKRMEQKNKKK